MFKPGTIYKNINCLDIVFKVEEVHQRLAKDRIATAFRLKGTWLNRYYGLIPIVEEVLIVEPDQLSRWAEYIPTTN